MHDRQLRNPRSFRHIIANSELMKSDLVERYRIEPGRITVIYPGFDPDVFQTDGDWSARLRQRRAELGLSDDDFVILFATSGAFRKRGVDRFLDGLAECAAAIDESQLRRRPVTALMIGKADQGELDSQVRARGLQRFVRYLATVKRIDRYYQAADVLVHSAVLEEFGQVIQEAAVSGCPVITSKWVGAAEIMGQAVGDYVMDEPTPAAIADRLLRTYGSARDAIRRDWIAKLSSDMKGNTWARNSELSHQLCMSVLEAKTGGNEPRGARLRYRCHRPRTGR